MSRKKSENRYFYLCEKKSAHVIFLSRKKFKQPENIPKKHGRRRWTPALVRFTVRKKSKWVGLFLWAKKWSTKWTFSITKNGKKVMRDNEVNSWKPKINIRNVPILESSQESSIHTIFYVNQYYSNNFLC